MKRIIFVILGVVALAVLIAGVAINNLDPEIVRTHLAKITKDATGKPLYMEQAPKLSFLPLGVNFGTAHWGMQDGKHATEGISVAVQGGMVRLAFMPLLTGRVVVEEIRLESPQVSVRPEKTSSPVPKQKEAAKDATAAGDIPLEIARLHMINASVVLDLEPNQVIRLQKWNAVLTDVKLGAHATVQWDMEFSSSTPAVHGSMAANMSLQQSGDALTVRGTVNFGDVVVADKGADTPSTSPKNTHKNTAPAQAPATSSAPNITYPTLDVDVRMASLHVAKLALTQLRAHVRGEGGRKVTYTIDPLALGLTTGGSLQGAASIALPSMHYTASGKAQEWVLGPIMQAVQGSRPVDAVLSAAFTLDCVGTTPTAIKNSLAGKGDVTVQDINLRGISLLPKAVPGLGGTSAGVPTHFDRLHIPFTIQSGVIAINPMTLMGKDAQAEGKGVVRLPQESLDMTVQVHTLGLQVPLTLKGPFSQIAYGVDPAWAAKTLMQAPGALIDGGKSTGGKAGDAVKGVGGAVKGLLKR